MENRRVDETVRALLNELKSGLDRIYGERLEGVYLYGSYARGEDHLCTSNEVWREPRSFERAVNAFGEVFVRNISIMV
jgi:hypothetical protein